MIDWFGGTRPRWNVDEELKYQSRFVEKLLSCVENCGDDEVCNSSAFQDFVRKHVDLSPLKAWEHKDFLNLDVSILLEFLTFRIFVFGRK